MEQNHPKPQNYLVIAIIGTLLCCIPGIVSVIYAAKVNGLYAECKLKEADAASKNAKTWAIVALVIGGLSIIANFVFGVAMFSALGEF